MSQSKNDLFYLCSLIEYISRITKNTKKDIVIAIGKENLTKIYSLASVLHTEPIEKISDEIIDKYHISIGNYSNDYYQHKIPTFWDMGKIYQRLIVMNSKDEDYITSLVEVLTSFIILKLDNYDSSLYYENPSYLYECYKEGKIL